MSTYTTWVIAILIALISTRMLVTVATVGKERKPVTPQVAAATAFIQLLMIATLVVALIKG